MKRDQVFYHNKVKYELKSGRVLINERSNRDYYPLFYKDRFVAVVNKRTSECICRYLDKSETISILEL